MLSPNIKFSYNFYIKISSHFILKVIYYVYNILLNTHLSKYNIIKIYGQFIKMWDIFGEWILDIKKFIYTYIR